MAKYITKKRIAAVALVLVLVSAFIVRGQLGRPDIKPVSGLPALSAQGQDGLKSFGNYLIENKEYEYPEGSWRFPLAQNSQNNIAIKSGGSFSFDITIPKTGLYSLKLSYKTGQESMYDSAISIRVNGEYPYYEAQGIPLQNIWEVDKENFTEGFLPKLKKKNGLTTESLYDRTGLYNRPLRFALTQGVSNITVEAEDYDIEINELILYNEKLLSYSDYQKTHTGNTASEPIFIQGEYADERNSTSILELSDNASAATLPSSIDKKTINTIGGTSYQTVSDRLTWKFSVTQAGLYTLNMRVRQDFSSGASSVRTLFIDEQIPFLECEQLLIPYNKQFFIFTPQSEKEEPYLFFLTAGEHTITLRTALGENAEMIERMTRVEKSLNSMYRRIMMLTSPDPDPYKDYFIEEKLPDVLAEMKTQKDILTQISGWLVYTNGSRSEDNTVLDKTVRQLEDFLKNPESIPSQLGAFEANKSAIGTWIQGKKEQPLEIDFIQFTPKDQMPPSANSGFFTNLSFAFTQFFQTFAFNYNSQKSTGDSIEVWMSAGRQQTELVSRLSDEYFTPQTGIKAVLKFVPAGTVLSAVVSGIGPDAALFNPNGDAVNFAARNAVADMTQFGGFDQLSAEFYESALLPLRWKDGVYGLPETQTFPVMFYRKDILDELGFEIPNTWDEAYQLMFDLQKNNMEFAIPTGPAGHALFLYQNGGKLYNDNLTETAISSEEGIKAFTVWSRYFTDFKVPLAYDFLNRFRSGAMPIGIADYTLYNTLIVFAPEIYDSWAIAPVPGIKQVDESINRSVPSGGTCSLIFSGSEKQEDAWSFLQWWNGSQAQRQYAVEIESRLGATARYAPANKTAFDNMMWRPGQLSVLKEQFSSVMGIPEIPGSYFTGRHVENAFKKIVLQNEDIKETVLEYTKIINAEITEKRKELEMMQSDGKGNRK